jgi:glutamine synthetase
MPGTLTLDTLRAAVAAGEIDTVVAAIVDMQGRLQGKRFHAQHFVDAAWHETHCCNYLLATDLEMITVPGYKATGWEAGYGDYTMRPDLSTLRRTAMPRCRIRPARCSSARSPGPGRWALPR